MAEELSLQDQIDVLRDQVDLLTKNMIGLQKALLLTNQRVAELQPSSIIDLNGNGLRRN
jgi:hypothetical protein